MQNREPGGGAEGEVATQGDRIWGGAVGRGVTGEGTEGQVRQRAIGCGEVQLVEV